MENPKNFYVGSIKRIWHLSCISSNFTTFLLTILVKINQATITNENLCCTKNDYLKYPSSLRVYVDFITDFEAVVDNNFYCV